MPLLIDGHNLIGQMKDISLDDPDDELQLVARLAAYRRRRPGQVVVVFDPGPHVGPSLLAEQQESGIRVLFARSGQRADELICALVRRASDRRGCIVVSSDRTVQAEVRRLGATVLAADEFALRLGRAPAPRPAEELEKERSLSSKEVEAWLKLFAGRGKPKR